ncbi:hypothetical protein LR68_03383 [Anoxybacillus sp. BCO1]|nr:hypothetical protein LR68_03383 [Anoxybacillus sp. BCO1]
MVLIMTLDIKGGGGPCMDILKKIQKYREEETKIKVGRDICGVLGNRKRKAVGSSVCSFSRLQYD